jgi:hypothetical protein
MSNNFYVLQEEYKLKRVKLKCGEILTINKCLLQDTLRFEVTGD